MKLQRIFNFEFLVVGVLLLVIIRRWVLDVRIRILVYIFCLILAKCSDFFFKTLDKFFKVWYDTKLNIFALKKVLPLIVVEIFIKEAYPL